MRCDISFDFDLPDDDEDLAAPHPDDADPEAPRPEDGDDDDLPPWHHPDPWTAEQAEAAYWERVEALDG